MQSTCALIIVFFALLHCEETQAQAPDMYVNASTFGLATTGTAETNTVALTKAVTAASSRGGGKVLVPCGTYLLSQFSFGATTNVTIEGCAAAYSYDAVSGGSKFQCNVGIWCVRMPNTATYPVLRNLTLASNGRLNSIAPNPIITAGVEYGLLVEGGVTVTEDVTVQGFQHGVVLANLGNQNIFTRMGIVWNTKTGFAVTLGSPSAYAAYHPNLAPPKQLTHTTTFLLSNSNIRRNGWGMILRDGHGIVRDTVVESNFFGGLHQHVGKLDSGVSYQFQRVHFENNWPAFSTKSAYTINQNNLLKETATTWIPWTVTDANSQSDAGYQISMSSAATGTAAGPVAQTFTDIQIVVQGQQKAAWLKSAYQTRFVGGSTSRGAGTDNFRLNAGSDGQYATATGFENHSATLPASLGNRGYAWQVDTGYNGGINWLAGSSKGARGSYMGTIAAGDMKVDGITGKIAYSSDGNTVTLDFPAAFSGASNAASFAISGAPAVIRPPTAKTFFCVSQDNAASFNIAVCTMNPDGVLSVFKNVNGNSFTPSGTKALRQGSTTYSLAQ